MIRAILYDLDGVLVDAVNIHKNAFNGAIQQIVGITLTDKEHEEEFNGLPTKRKLDILLQQNRIYAAHVPFIERLKQEITISAINAFFTVDYTKTTLHSWTKRHNIKIACVTNSIRETAELMLIKTAQLRYMNVLISNQDVDYPKPSPEGYFKAMALLGVKPSSTLIVEDSEKGVSAAIKTGAYVMRVHSPADVNIDSIRSQVIENSFGIIRPTTLP